MLPQKNMAILLDTQARSVPDWPSLRPGRARSQAAGGIKKAAPVSRGGF